MSDAPAIPPVPPDIPASVYTRSDPNFTGLVASELGTALTDEDGFHAIFDDAANSYPGPNVVVDGLDPLLGDFVEAQPVLDTDPDPSFIGDLTAATDLASRINSELNLVGSNIPTTPLAAFPDVGTLAQGQLPPGFLRGDQDTALREIPSTTVKLTEDGNVSWYIEPAEPDPIQVFVTIDGGPWSLFAEGKQGNTSPSWIQAGSITVFEWRNPRGILAQAFIDLRGHTVDTSVQLPNSNASASTIGSTVTPTGGGPNSIPPVAADAIPAATLSANAAGLIIWQTANCDQVQLTESTDSGAPEVLSLLRNSAGIHKPLFHGHAYTFRVMGAKGGAPFLELATQTVDLTDLPSIPLPSGPVISTAVAGNNQVLTPAQSAQLAAITNNPNAAAFLNGVPVGSTAAQQRTVLLTYGNNIVMHDGTGNPIVQLPNGLLQNTSNGQFYNADQSPTNTPAWDVAAAVNAVNSAPPE